MIPNTIKESAKKVITTIVQKFIFSQKTESFFNYFRKRMSIDAYKKRYGIKAFNKPIKTPSHRNKSHLVVAKEGGIVKVIRFGQQGVKGSPFEKGETKENRTRRVNWYKRHAKNIKKGKLSAAYWAAKTKW